MYSNLRVVRKYTIGSLLENTQNKRFFTQKEFEDNIGKIYAITGAIRNLNEKLKEI